MTTSSLVSALLLLLVMFGALLVRVVQAWPHIVRVFMLRALDAELRPLYRARSEVLKKRRQGENRTIDADRLAFLERRIDELEVAEECIRHLGPL